MADRSISYVFRANFSSLTAGLTAASRGVQDFGGRLTALDRDGERMRRGLSSIGDAAGKIGLAAAGGLGVVIAVTAKFESAMSRVSAATNASASDLEKLRKAAIQAGADTIFSASGAADGITELGKAGLSTSDILSGGLTGALNLAAAGQLEVADAANITATTLQQFGLQGDQASRVADVLAASANKAMGDVTDMSEALKYVGPVSAQMGLSLEETAGAIAELAQQGILGSQAGTSLRGVMTALTSPSKQAALTMQGLGISMYDAQGEFVGLDGIAGQLHDTMGSLSNAERDQALGRIFGNEQITTARILYAGGSADVQKWTAAVTDSGFAAEQAATLTDNLAGDIEALKGSFETAIIGTGESSQGPLRGLVQNLTDVVNGYSSLPGPAKSATGAAIGLTAAIGGGAFVFAKAISGLAGMQTSLVNMGVSAERAATSTKVLGRVGVGAAGLGLFAAGLASTNKAMATLETTAGGAALGFAVGGPWGAAVGGAIGLITGLAKSHDDTTEAVKATAATFDVETGAITDNTRVKVAATLQTKGYFDTLEQLGVSTEVATDAVMGQAAAQDQLNAALAAADPTILTDSLADLQSQYGDTQGQATFNQQQEAARQKVADLTAGLGVQSDRFKQSSTDAKQLAGAVSGAGTATFQTAEQVADAAKALDESRKAAEQTAQGFFNLGDSLNDSKVSLNGWIDDLEKQANALRDFRKNSVEAADKGLRGGLIQALKDAGPEGAMRLGQLANASEKEIGRANKAWKRGQSEIAAYVDQTMKVPASVSTNVTANTGQASTAIEQLVQRLARVNGYTATTYIRTVNKAAGGGKGADAVTAGPLGGAFASGGFTGRGGKYEVAGVVHRGEVVIPSDRVARDWSSLKARYGDLPGFADGGFANQSARSGTGNLDVDLKMNLAGLKRELKKFEKALDEATTAVDKSKSAYDAVQSNFDSLAGSVSGLFHSDLFATDNKNPFSTMTAGADPLGVLQSDIANSQQFQGLFAALANRGVNGDALASAAQSGVGALQTLSNYSDAELQQYQQDFGIREQQAAAAANLAGTNRYGAELADALKNYADDKRELREVKHAVNQVEAAIKNRQEQAKKHAEDQKKSTDKLSSSAARGKRDRPRSRR